MHSVADLRLKARLPDGFDTFAEVVEDMATLDAATSREETTDDTGDTTAAPAAVIVAFLIKSLLSISLVISYSQFFLNLSANIRKSGNYLLYLPQVYD